LPVKFNAFKTFVFSDTLTQKNSSWAD